MRFFSLKKEKTTISPLSLEQNEWAVDVFATGHCAVCQQSTRSEWWAWQAAEDETNARKELQQIRLELQNYNTVVAHSGHACSKVALCVNTPTYQMTDQSITNEGCTHMERMAGHLKQKRMQKADQQHFLYLGDFSHLAFTQLCICCSCMNAVKNHIAY